MKRINKLAAIIIASSMAAFLVAPTFTNLSVNALGTNSLEISGIDEVASHTFDMYQIMTGTYTEDVPSDMRWGSGITEYQKNGSDDKITTNAGNAVDPVILKEILDTEESNQAKTQLISRFTVNPANKTTKTSANGTVTFSNLDTGYYLVKDVTEGISGNDSISGDILVYINGADTATVKSVKPSFDKVVSKDGTILNWAEVADYNIGDTVKFKLTAEIPNNSDLISYDAYKLLFTDTYSDGLTFGAIDSVTYKVGSDEAVAVEPYVAETNADGYKLVETPTQEGQPKTGFTIELTDLEENIPTAKWGVGGDFIVVTVIYSATLNSSAPSVSATTSDAAYADATSLSANGAKISYSNNPANSESIGQTAVDNVGVFTYKMENTKYANIATEGYELNGAKFTLHKDTADGDAVSMFYDSTLNAYRPVIAGETQVENMLSGYGVSGHDGKLDIVGLDAGTYVLIEDEAPDGYTKIEDKTFTIAAALAEAATGESATATLTLTDIADLTGNNIIDTLTTDKPLPSTGGIGTTIFYTVGSIMVIGAGTILIAKKRIKINNSL